MADSTVTITGTLGADVELRYSTGGMAIASIRMAVNRRWQKNGEWQEETSWFAVTAFAEMGENCAASLTKGSRAIVTGRLQQRSWETKEGEKRSVVEIIADEIGPSLRWAQAQIERTEREKPTNESRQANTGSGGGTSGQGYDYADSEDPFVMDARIEDL